MRRVQAKTAEGRRGSAAALAGLKNKHEKSPAFAGLFRGRLVIVREQNGGDASVTLRDNPELHPVGVVIHREEAKALREG